MREIARDFIDLYGHIQFSEKYFNITESVNSFNCRLTVEKVLNGLAFHWVRKSHIMGCLLSKAIVWKLNLGCQK